MNSATVPHYKQLCENLHQLVRVYRSLLQIVRKEREILVATDLDELNENNRAKEVILTKVKQLEQQRLQNLQKLCESEKLAESEQSLLQLSIHFNDERGEKLRHFHSVLELLVKRVQEFNMQNDHLVHSALRCITETMNAMAEKQAESKTYKPQGKHAVKAEAKSSGRIMSKEA